MHTVKHVSGGILWANMHLLLWLSLSLSLRAGFEKTIFSALPLMLYSLVLLIAGLAYHILERTIIVQQGEQSLLKKAIRHDIKSKLSVVLYFIGIISTFFCSMGGRNYLCLSSRYVGHT